MWSVHTHRKKESFGLSREDGVYYKGRVVWGRRGQKSALVEDVLSSGDVLDVKHRCRAGHRREESGARREVRAEGSSSIMVALTDMAWGHSPASVDEGEEPRAEPWALDSCGSTGAQDEAGIEPGSLGVGTGHTWETGPGSPAVAWATLSQLLPLSLWLPCAPQGLCVSRDSSPHT